MNEKKPRTPRLVRAEAAGEFAPSQRWLRFPIIGGGRLNGVGASMSRLLVSQKLSRIFTACFMRHLQMHLAKAKWYLTDAALLAGVVE